MQGMSACARGHGSGVCVSCVSARFSALFFAPGFRACRFKLKTVIFTVSGTTTLSNFIEIVDPRASYEVTLQCKVRPTD